MGQDSGGNGAGKTHISETRVGRIASSPLGGFVLAGSFRGRVGFGTTQLVGPNCDSSPVPFVAHLSDSQPLRPELQVHNRASEPNDSLQLWRFVGVTNGNAITSQNRS